MILFIELWNQKFRRIKNLYCP